MKRLFSVIAIMLAVVFAIAGCSGGSGIATVNEPDGNGSYRVSIDWPDDLKGDKDEARYIPSGTQSIFIEITGDGLTQPVTASIAYPVSMITVDDLPVGNKVALIKALDASSMIKSQRKEAFVIQSTHTTDSGNIPLGVAITGTSSSPSFEPSSINVGAGTDLYFQNWTNGNFTCRVNMGGSNYDLTLPGCYTDGTGKWIFSQDDQLMSQSGGFSLVERPSATGSVVIPITNYAFVRLWGGMGSANEQFYYPLGVDIDSANRVYVCDQVYQRIKVFTTDGVFIRKFNMDTTTPPGNPENPYDVGVSSTGFVYIADYHGRSLQKFNTAGVHQKTITFGTMSFPTGIEVDNQGNVYMPRNNAIYKYDADLNQITSFGSNGSGNGQFINPYDVVVDNNSGNIYVADTDNERIQVLSSTGAFMRKWGTSGTGNDQFAYPSYCALDSAGNILVTDMYNHRIQKFDSFGNFMTKWGTGGTGNGQFDWTWGIAVDSQDNVYVTDFRNHRLQKFRPAP